MQIQPNKIIERQDEEINQLTKKNRLLSLMVEELQQQLAQAEQGGKDGSDSLDSE